MTMSLSTTIRISATSSSSSSSLLSLNHSNSTTLSFNPTSSCYYRRNIPSRFLSIPSLPNSKPCTPTPILSRPLTSPTPTPTPQLESLKSRLLNGDTLYGMFLCSFSPTLAEIAGLSGYDFVVVDMEHGFGGIPEALHCLRALAATHTPAILRLPETTAAWTKKALDLGPQGIMFPMIDTPNEARKAVSFCRYPPNGLRGAAHPIVRASGYGIDAGYLTNCEDELLIMCQVESEEVVDKVEEIAAVDGVDCIQMGPTDLSASMGYLWDPGNNKVREMMKRVEKGVLDGGAYLCGFAMPHDSPEQLKSRGYHMVSGAVDIGLFRTAALHDVNKFKMSLEMMDDDDDDPTAEGKDADDDQKYWSE